MIQSWTNAYLSQSSTPIHRRLSVDCLIVWCRWFKYKCAFGTPGWVWTKWAKCLVTISASQHREAPLWLNGLIFQLLIIPIVAQSRHDLDNVDRPGSLHLFFYSSHTHKQQSKWKYGHRLKAKLIEVCSGVIMSVCNLCSELFQDSRLGMVVFKRLEYLNKRPCVAWDYHIMGSETFSFGGCYYSEAPEY